MLTLASVQKDEWFLRLNPNGRIPTLVDNSQSPPFPVHETSAEMLYLLKFADKEDKFGFKDELERNECLQWLFFWHGEHNLPPPTLQMTQLNLSLGSGAPYQGQVSHFTRAAPEKIPCKFSVWGKLVDGSSHCAQTPSIATATKSSEFLVCSRSVCPGNTPASLATIWLDEGKAVSASPISRPGHGSETGSAVASLRTR